MSYFKDLQQQIMENKINHNFNLTDINLEFCYLMDELGEAHQAYIRGYDDLGEELADVAIYLLGLAEMLGIDLETEISNKMEKNKKRVYYKDENGVLKKKEGI